MVCWYCGFASCSELRFAGRHKALLAVRDDRVGVVLCGEQLFDRGRDGFLNAGGLRKKIKEIRQKRAAVEREVKEYEDRVEKVLKDLRKMKIRAVDAILDKFDGR